MYSIRQKKLIWVAATLLGTMLAVLLIIYALQEKTDFYFDPSMIVMGEAPQNKRIRAGGIVVAGSILRDNNNPLDITFNMTDCQATIKVKYTGILPDLFAENSGVVVTGILQQQVLMASHILAKHDESYMPPEVADSLKPTNDSDNASTSSISEDVAATSQANNSIKYIKTNK